jgi:hypothetical protein
MKTEKYYTSAEAVARFIEAGLSETTFRRRVKEGAIKGDLPEGRMRGAFYPKAQVEEAIKQSTKKPEIESAAKEESKGQIDWARSSDLPYLLAYSYQLYGPEHTLDISITHAWWEKNPFMVRILFDANDRRSIWGEMTIVPMEEETIFRLLRGEMQKRDIGPEHIQVYEPGRKYYGYVVSATVRPEYRMHFRKLIQSVLTYWCEQYPATQFIKLYTYVGGDEDLDLIKHLFFSPRYDIGENAFELNPYRRNPSRLLKAFQECIQRKEEANLRE